MNHYTLNLIQLIKDKNIDGIVSYIIEKLPMFISALVILILGFIFSNFIGKLVVKGLEKKNVDPSTHTFIRTIVTLLLKFAFVLSALSALNVNVSSFITAIGAAGITAGLGLQASISQFASGMQILFNHPFKSGDFIDVGTVSGKVYEIKMMYTVLITVDNKRVIIPNSTITSSNIINYNAENRRRLDLVFSVSYDVSIDEAKKAIREVIEKNNLIFTTPEPIIAVKEHADSSIKIACLAWCPSDNYWDVFYYMQEEVKLSFDRHGISIPYGQLDVHITKE